MAEINIITNCFTSGANLGVGACKRTPGKITHLIFVPKGTIYTASDLLTMQATLKADAINNDKLQRVQILPVIINEDQTTDVVRDTYPDGSSEVVTDPRYRWQFLHTLGTCVHNNLLKGYNGNQAKFDVIFADKQALQAELAYNDDGEIIGLKGAALRDIYVPPYTAANNENNARFYIEIELEDTSSRNEDGGYADITFPLSNIPLVQDVTLGLVAWTSGPNGTVQVAAMTGCGGLNMVDLYPTALANAAAFTARNVATGLNIPITGVTTIKIQNSSRLVIDFDQTSPNYPAANGKIALNIASVSALAALGITYYEAVDLILTRPA